MVIFDFDQTLVDTSSVEGFRRNRDWKAVMTRLGQLQPYPGIGAFLGDLHDAGQKLAIVTRSPDMVAKAIAKRESWPVDIFVGYHAVSRQKPDPEGLLLALEKAGERAEESFHVGDNPEDTQAARAANIVALGSSWGLNDDSALLASRPDRIFSTVGELRAFLMPLLRR